MFKLPAGKCSADVGKNQVDREQVYEDEESHYDEAEDGGGQTG